MRRHSVIKRRKCNKHAQFTMMEPERDGNNSYPWVLYDSDEFCKAWSIQLIPELQIRRIYKNDSLFHVIINVNHISVDEISMKHDREYLIIQGDYKEKKEKAYECYTAFNHVRRIKLPKGVNMNYVDTWTSRDGFLNILAPIDESPEQDGLVTIYYPCANSKTVTDIARRTLNCVQQYRFESMFKPKKSPSPGTVKLGYEKMCAPCYPARNPRALARSVRMSGNQGNAPAGTIRGPYVHVRPSDGNIRALGIRFAQPRDRNAQDDNVSAPSGRIIFVHENMYGPAGDICSPGGAPMMGPGGNIRRVVAANNYNQPIGTVNNYNQPISAANNYNQPISAANNYNQPISAANNYNQPNNATNNYNQPNDGYEGRRYPQGMYQADNNRNAEYIAIDNRYYIIPRKDYIYGAEMDPNTINHQ